MLKVRFFKTTNDHRPFLSKFYVKLGFRHFQRCESTKQPQFNAELAAGDYRFRKSITAGGLQPGVTSRLRYLLQNEYNSRWASGTSSATSRLSNHNVPSGPSANPYVEARSAELTRGGLQFLCVLLLNKLAITKLGCYVFYLEASSAIVQISLCI